MNNFKIRPSFGSHKLKNKILVNEVNGVACGYHFHSNFELFYLFNETAEAFVGSEWLTLSPGECALIFPNQVHAYNAPQARAAIIILASEYTVSNKYKKSIPKNPVVKLSPDTHAFIAKNLKSESDELMPQACLYAICSEFERQTEFICKPAAELSIQHKILLFLQENFTKDITLSDLAENIGYCYKYLSRILNNLFKKTFNELLNEYRVDYAAELLRESSDSITDIAFQCGFDSIRSFNRNFCKIMSANPSEYRKF